MDTKRNPKQPKPRQRKHSSSTPAKPTYYAGARFETSPTVSSLPCVPTRWTMSSPTPRSQSMPTSPITTNNNGNMMWMESTTWSSGEGLRPLTSKPATTIFKSASFPGDSSLISSLFRVKEPVVKTNAQIPTDGKRLETGTRARTTSANPPAQTEEKVDLIQMLIQATPKKAKEQEEVQTQEKKFVVESPPKLIPRSVSRPCQFEVGQEYKDITQHLKSLLKVSV